MTTPVSVVIPVGPFPSNTRWLREAIDSVINQTLKPSDILLIGDGTSVTEYAKLAPFPTLIRVWESPARVGIAHAFNCGIALAMSELVFMMGSDDIMLPDCLADCVRTYEQCRVDGYYHISLDYADEDGKPLDKIQTLPCNAAMVTKAFWQKVGGFPIEAAVGAPDRIMISLLMTRMPECLIPVAEGKPNLLVRVHPDTYTAKTGKTGRFGLVDMVNSYVMENWKDGMVQ